MERKLIKEQKEEISLYSLLDGQSFDGAIEELKELEQHFKKKYPKAIKLYLDISSYGYDGGVECYLMVERLEYDSEFTKRVASAEKAKLAKEERQRKAEEKARALILDTEAKEKELLKQLQAKYGVVK